MGFDSSIFLFLLGGASRAGRGIPARLQGAGLLLCVWALLQGCASGGAAGTGGRSIIDPRKEPAAGYLISTQAFARKSAAPPAGPAPAAAPATSPAAKAAPAKPGEKTDNKPPERIALLKGPQPSGSVAQAPFVPQVLLYASPVTRQYLNAGGLDDFHRIQVWQDVLTKYKFPFRRIDSPAQIDIRQAGVLVLPSSLALSRAERQAIVDFRAAGGSVLVTWAAGVRDESGAWSGFGFMEDALDTPVVGTTADDKAANFLMINGATPVNQALPAGQRMWTERALHWFPLRMKVATPTMHMMDWSRNFKDEVASAVGHYHERRYGNGAQSRLVAIGLPERLWVSGNPEYLEALAHNSLTWLLRLPSAQLATWPAHHQSAMLLTMDCAEILLEPDVAFIKQVQDAGFRMTLYVFGDNAKKGAERLKQVSAWGHELAVQGDKFAGFRGLAAEEQARRLEAALARIKDAGLSLPERPSFHAPMDAYDKNTLALIARLGFGHYVATQEVGETRLPVIERAPGNEGQTLVAFPRTQRGPEDAVEEGDIDEGLNSFLAEFAQTVQSGSLALVRLPSQSILTPKNLKDVTEGLKAHAGATWGPTASQLAQWWLDRARLKVQLEGTTLDPRLVVEMGAGAPLAQPAAVIVNLPMAGQQLRLLLDGKDDERLKITRLNDHQLSVLLPPLPAGRHQWSLSFAASAAPRP